MALSRGPLVYCVEQADNPALRSPQLAPAARRRLAAAERSDLFDGIVAMAAPGEAAEPPSDWNGDALPQPRRRRRPRRR